MTLRLQKPAPQRGAALGPTVSGADLMCLSSPQSRCGAPRTPASPAREGGQPAQGKGLRSGHPSCLGRRAQFAPRAPTCSRLSPPPPRAGPRCCGDVRPRELPGCPRGLRKHGDSPVLWGPEAGVEICLLYLSI